VPLYKFEDIAHNVTNKKKPVENDKYTYLGLEHLDPGTLIVTRFGAEVAPKGEKLIMKKGDVLFGKRRAYQKKVAIAPFDGIFSAHGMVLRPKEDVIDKNFFPLFISSDYFLDKAIQISVGSLSPTINWRDLKVLEFDLPEKEEQGKLAALLWAANDTKEAYKRLLDMTNSLVQSQFVAMFGLPTDNTKGFNKGTIRDVISEAKYGTSKPANDGGKYPYLRMNNITYEGQLDLTDLKLIDLNEHEVDKYVVRKGDILFNRTNSKELVGKTCLFNLESPMIIAGYIIRMSANEKVLPEYLTEFLNLKYSKDILYDMCKAAIGQANINAQELQNIEILIPPKSLQYDFLALQQNIDKSKFALRQSISAIDSTIQTLMNLHIY